MTSAAMMDKLDEHERGVTRRSTRMVADHGDLAMGQRRPRRSRPGNALDHRPRRPASDALPPRLRELASHEADASFTWEGAWEYDPVRGTGSVEVGKDGRLRGRIEIEDGDESTFVGEPAPAPAGPIPDPPARSPR